MKTSVQICENCKIEHNGKYGSGRFCNYKCARSFSSKDKREIMNKKVSVGLIEYYKTHISPNKGKKWTIEKCEEHAKKLIECHKRKEQELIKNTSFEKLNQRLRNKILFNERGKKCEDCGYNYIDDKLMKGPYEIHHKDGNKKNNKKTNLKIVCLNCHWKTGNYRFRNKHHTFNSTMKMLKTKLSRGKIKKINNNIYSELV